MKSSLMVVLMSGLLSIQGGCGESIWVSFDDVEAEVEAEVALGRALAMGAYASAEAVTVVDQMSGTGDVDIVVACEEGGTLEATGRLTSWGMMVDLDITLLGCSEGGLVMDGRLRYTASSSPAGSVRTVVGVVTYAGPIEIDACAMDATEELLRDEQVLVIRGSVCGREVDREYE